jgi:hypothetical protein
MKKIILGLALCFCGCQSYGSNVAISSDFTLNESELAWQRQALDLIGRYTTLSAAEKEEFLNDMFCSVEEFHLPLAIFPIVELLSESKIVGADYEKISKVIRKALGRIGMYAFLHAPILSTDILLSKLRFARNVLDVALSLPKEELKGLVSAFHDIVKYMLQKDDHMYQFIQSYLEEHGFQELLEKVEDNRDVQQVARFFAPYTDIMRIINEKHLENQQQYEKEEKEAERAYRQTHGQ